MNAAGSFGDFFGWASLAYLLGMNLVYLTLNVVSFVVLWRHRSGRPSVHSPPGSRTSSYR